MLVDHDVAAILEGLADGVGDGGAARAKDVDGSLAALEGSIAAQVDAVREDARYAPTTALYRELGVAVNRVVSAYSRSLPAIELEEVTG